jgi:hypothetical protein
MCKICENTGWVCEKCGTRWELENGGTCCGAGSNCVCNPNGNVEWIAVHASTNKESVKNWTH